MTAIKRGCWLPSAREWVILLVKGVGTMGLLQNVSVMTETLDEITMTLTFRFLSFLRFISLLVCFLVENRLSL